METKTKEIIKRYLQFMCGFEESTLYIDYKVAEDYTDEDYEEAIATLEEISR